MTALLIFAAKIFIVTIAVPFICSMSYGAIRGAKDQIDRRTQR